MLKSHLKMRLSLCCSSHWSPEIQGVPKKCIHSLNRYNLIKLLIFAFKYIDAKERINI